MSLTFDERGNVLETVEISFPEFQGHFVEKFQSDNSTRQAIFKDFETYIEDFKTLITPNFEMWVDGSFLCQKRDRPNDIDFVSFIDYKIYNANEKLIDNRFSKHRDKMFYPSLDAHVFKEYPPNHEEADFANADKLYWVHLFSKTKKDRNNKNYGKGFVKSKFN